VSLQLDAERGRLAQDVLNNAVFADAYAQLEKGIVDRWKDSRNADDREELHRQLMALLLLRSQVESVMRSGQVALDKLGREQTRADRMLTGLRPRAA
jgi:hypothetical protein